MSDITPLGRPTAPQVNLAPRSGKTNGTPQTVSTRGTDSVEVSPVSKYLAQLHELPDVRQGLVNRVKSEIAAGTYDTPDKVDALLPELSQDLG